MQTKTYTKTYTFNEKIPIKTHTISTKYDTKTYTKVETESHAQVFPFPHSQHSKN
jgi:hypothetical protein